MIIQPCPGCAATNQVQLERIAALEAQLAAARASISDALKYLGPEAPDCIGCSYEWDHAITVLRAAIDAARGSAPTEG